MPANKVFKNGRIYTLNPSAPLVSAVAVDGNHILATGDDLTIEALLSSGGQLIDLNGCCVTPGLIDAHVHFRSFALGLQRLDLDRTGDLQEVLQTIQLYLEGNKSDDWVLGRGWNQADWPDSRYPSKAILDQLIPNRPAFLRHHSGHAAWLNSRALTIAGITRDTPDPPGGQIQRSEDGNPTGILFEKAIDLVRQVVPKPRESELVQAMQSAQQQCIEAGLTGFHDFDGRSCFQALQTLHLNKKLRLRAVKNIPLKLLDHALKLGLRSGFGDDRLSLGSVKMFADGALGPRTAALMKPYENESSNTGIIVTEKEEMMEQAIKASDGAISVAIHAIGDRANHDVLDVFEAVRKQEEKRSSLSEERTFPLRHRIEHAQLLHPPDFNRFSELGIIASMQPIHATSDMEMADRYWGERARYSYAWRSLAASGATLIFGSDSPVESIKPLTGIFAAVNRYRLDNPYSTNGWYPEQRLSLEEVIYAYTMGPAIASGREKISGSISPGKLADFTVFDRDIFRIPPGELLDVKIAGTVLDGDLAYRTW